MALVLLLAAVFVGYLLGSIPFGILACKAKGLDPRLVGSGRTGGTNVYRTAGMPAALVTVVGDIMKGYIAVEVADQLFTRLGPSAPDAHLLYPAALALAAIAAIVGHNYSVYLGFRGGAGTSPNAGAIMWFDPVTFLLVLPVAILFIFVVRIASIASLAVSATILIGLSVRVYQGNLPPALLIYGIGQLLLVVWALRPNIARLMSGTEPRIQFGKSSDPEPGQ